MPTTMKRLSVTKGAKLKVLFVEDSEFFAKLVLGFFAEPRLQADFELSHCGNLGDSIALARTVAFDVALMDLSLPDATGFRALSEIQRAFPELPVVLLTANDDENMALLSLANGAQDYVVKSEVTGTLLQKGLRYAVERKRTEILLAQQNALLMNATKLTALGEMASGIAHEVNNPLSMIYWKAGELLTLLEQGKDSRENLLLGLNKIRSTTERIVKLVRSLRSLSRDGSNDPSEELDLKILIAEAIEVVHERARSSQITVLQEIPNESIRVTCRSVQVVQSLLNLLNNAFDAVEPESEKWVKISVVLFADHLEIQVCDSGRGFSPEAKAKVFHPFFTTKPVGSGTGLGLCLSRKMLEREGWELSLIADSPVTCFRISVPESRFRRVG